MRKLPLLALACPFFCAAPAVTSAAALKVTLTPKKVLDGSRVHVTVSRVHPGSYYTLLLVGPHPKTDRALVGLVRARSNGTISIEEKLPVIAHCGKSTMYVLDSKRVVGHGALTLTGCTLKHGPPPPPPPGH